MSSLIVYAGGRKEITLGASEALAAFSYGSYKVYQVVGYPNYPESESLLDDVASGAYTSSVLTNGGTMIIENTGASDVLYQVGAAPVVTERSVLRTQGAPVAVNTTGAVSATAILGGIVTSSTAAAVAGTVPTGTVMDAATEMAIGDAVHWSVINTGGSNAFTVTAATDHTLVGGGAVSANTSGLFLTRKTAATTFVTYRIG